MDDLRLPPIAGLRPANPFGGAGGASAASFPAVFRPAAAPADALSTAPDHLPVEEEEDSVQAAIPEGAAPVQPGSARSMASPPRAAQHHDSPLGHHRRSVDSVAAAAAAAGGGGGGAAASDPVVQEVLAFWCLYRGQGYEAEAMAEWVRQVSCLVFYCFWYLCFFVLQFRCGRVEVGCRVSLASWQLNRRGIIALEGCIRLACTTQSRCSFTGRH